MNISQGISRFGILFVVLLVIVACTPTPTPVPTATQVPATLAPMPTSPQALPTNTPLPAPTPGGPVSFVWKITGEPEPFNSPTSLALDKQGNLYVFDSGNGGDPSRTRRVLKYSPEGKLITQWGSNGTGDGQFGFNSYPAGQIAVDAQENVYVADTGNWRIQKFDGNGKFLMAFGQYGKGDGLFTYLLALAVDSQGYIYAADGDNQYIQKFDSKGKFITKFASPGVGDGKLIAPVYLAIDDQGNIFVADATNDVQKFSPDGRFLAHWHQCGGNPLRSSYGVTLDKQGNIYVAEYGLSGPANRPNAGNQVCKLDHDGNFLYAWGGGGSGDGQMSRPGGIAVDDVGNVYVAETGNHRIQKFRQQ